MSKPTVHQLLREAKAQRRVLVQPRCGVGSHTRMTQLLQQLERDAQPDILTLTIDSYTRLLHFDVVTAMLAQTPDALNGYPLVSHGWQRGRELNDAVRAPLQIRHGSPDARQLFECSLMAGITAFEGGGISYNVPYSKDVPLATSLSHWQEIDRTCGELADQEQIYVDRELFGTLTAVLIPPAISLSVTLLEAILAAREGVKCISIAYPQGGNLVQDVAALRAIPRLMAQHLPADVEVFTVFHEWMGPFPRARATADALIFYGALTARLGGANKVVNKSYMEAFGIPSAEANVSGVHTTRAATSKIFDFVELPEAEVADEMAHILEEVNELIAPVVDSADPMSATLTAFARGWLDIPFSPSCHVRSAVLPMRDPGGSIRVFEFGNLCLSEASKKRHQAQLGRFTSEMDFDHLRKIQEDIFHFCRTIEQPALPELSSLAMQALEPSR
ncbi:methylaspartate mutase [Haliangium ochraceum]|nr:methylaspartate mutase [Haliangium ochraceum]